MKRIVSFLLAITMVFGFSFTASAEAPPKYKTKMFSNVNELVTWIQNEKLDSFQEGRYKKGISSLRNLGKVLSLSYASPDITMKFIEVPPDKDFDNGNTDIVYYFYTKTQRVVVFVKQMDANYTEQSKNGLNSYFTAKYGSEFKNLPTLEAGSVKYIKKVVSDTDWSSGEAIPSEEKSSMCYFLSNGFEIEVSQDLAVEDERFIRDLKIEPIVFASTSSSSSKSSSTAGTTKPAQSSSPLSAAAGKTAVQNALKSVVPGSKKASVSIKNISSVSLSVLKEMAKEAQKAGVELTVNFDQVIGNKVMSRLGINPALSKNDIDVTMSTNSAQAKKVQSLMTRWFSNDILVISCGQKESFGQSVAIVVALPEKLSTANLKFYSYDSTKNRYTVISDINYRIDNASYIHITTETAGDIVVSDGLLSKK